MENVISVAVDEGDLNKKKKKKRNKKCIPTNTIIYHWIIHLSGFEMIKINV